MELITEEDETQAESHPTLGAAYFTTRRIAAALMEGMETDDFKQVVEAYTNAAKDKIWQDVQDWLLIDTETNLHNQMRYIIDSCIRCILTGKKWAIDKYVLGQNHDSEEVRQAIFEVIPDELKSQRIIDLETEVEKLKKDMEWLRNR